MKIRWYGHSCFALKSENGAKVVTDPFDASVGYDVPSLEADILTISHGHHDHNNTAAVSGNPDVLDCEGNHEIKGIAVEGIQTFHDDDNGSMRGRNSVFKYTIDGMTLCHLGDLGHMLSDELLQKLKGLDILFIPVGGTYTIDSKQAAELAKQLSPKVIIPMHYKTDKLKFNLEPVDNFVREYGHAYFTKNNVLNVEKDTLKGESKVMVLEYECS